MCAMSGASEGEGLRAIYDRARAAWPGVAAVAYDVFATRVGEGGGAAAVAAHAEDLYLACACAAQDPAALREFERHHLAGVRAAVARIDHGEDFAAEVQQLLRERLFVGEQAKIGEYRGTGPLAGWVRTAAVRTALNLLRAGKREVSAEESSAALAQLLDPETALLRQHHRSEIDRALANALARLAPDERVLLRWTYLDRLTLAKVALLQGVSAPTVHRRLAATTATLLAEVRRDLATRLALSGQSLDSLIGAVDVELGLSLSRLLRDA